MGFNGCFKALMARTKHKPTVEWPRSLWTARMHLPYISALC